MKTDLQRAEESRDAARQERDRLRTLFESSGSPQTRLRLEEAETKYEAARKVHDQALEVSFVEREEFIKQNLAKAALFDAQASKAMQEQEVRSHQRRKERELHALEAAEKHRLVAEEAAKRTADREVQRQLRALDLAAKLKALKDAEDKEP